MRLHEEHSTPLIHPSRQHHDSYRGFGLWWNLKRVYGKNILSKSKNNAANINTTIEIHDLHINSTIQYLFRKETRYIFYSHFTKKASL